jgi:hypothetical protein
MNGAEVKGFSHGDAYYVPVWIEPDGTEWHYEGIPEGCEHRREPFDPDRDFDLSSELEKYDCPNFVERVGERGKIRIQLCREHFEQEIKRRCRVLWFEWQG